MAEYELSSLIRELLPETDEPVTQYLAGYVTDPSTDAAEALSVSRSMLESFAPSLSSSASSSPSPSRPQTPTELDKVLTKIAEVLDAREVDEGEGELRTLDRVMNMKRSAGMSATLALQGGGVDLESINKGKESRVDMKKLEKQEAKLRAKIEKRSRRDLYEGSKLLATQKKQQSYEEMFLKVNPMDSIGAAKGKSKDIHLVNVDVTFGSHRILTGASLTLAFGRRYGLIGRNGVGKSTLLRHIAMRDIAIPKHITILFVEQEIVGDDTLALQSVLSADVWRERLLAEQEELDKRIASLAEGSAEMEEAGARLAEVHEKLAEMDVEGSVARAAGLLAGLGFTEADQKRPTREFSGGWRMRLALARALFVKPDLLMLDEPSNHIDLNALAWLEDYLQTWQGTILVVSHDRAFLDAVATDIVWQHSGRLDYFKGNFTQFYATKTEREKNQRKEYETQMAYRAHLQAFIDRWRYNANRAAQAQSRIKTLESLPDLEEPEQEETEMFKFPDAEKISPPLLQLSEVTFGYSPDKLILKGVNIDVGLDSRMAIIGSNGAGKSTLIKLLTGELKPLAGEMNRNGRLRIAYFAQHHVDTLPPQLSPVSFLASRFPGKSEQEYRSHLGSFGITGITGLQTIATLSGGQKSRVAFAALSLQNPHILLLDEPTNHLDVEGLDALRQALENWNGGVIVISHDERFITGVANQLWVCADGTVMKYKGDVQAYKELIVGKLKSAKP
ncbi:hypothetical protein DACRYDRAFT_24014 [Dacryopinax primogenitus]|uniref:ABC transporter domain-containing protein n=1 Tax=Dacryopinax primogenitus (strain DJM 731) TaxID=1858805 RepID=M5FQ01_DACPD|nr:uncharacterized protein DACRYDRAFT_24014 [Dacryopinax primogenitus]EJT98885.1 hypothetical protein DACRYDRAFT_24014 [Dacryopinax primogenitus]